MNQRHLNFICTELQFSSPEGVATRVYGGRGGHLMWRVNTESESYAIKQLTPNIDLNNKRVITKYELSETIAYRFIQQGVPAVSAIRKSGKHLIIIESTGYLVYPWVEGYNLGRNEISETHALKIAELLAKLHSINLSVPEIEPPHFDIHTNDSIIEAIEKSVAFKCLFAKTLKENQGLILSMNDDYLAAIPFLKEHNVVTHGDVDQQNVRWDKTDQPILIDWESAKKMNPTREIIRACLAWSGIGTENFSLSIYAHMLHTYYNSDGALNINHVNAALYAMFGSLLNWMLYNIEATCTSNLPEERDIGIKEVNWVVMTMMRLKLKIPDLLQIIIET